MTVLAAVLLAVGQKHRSQMVAIAAGGIYGLLRMLTFAFARGKLEIFRRNIPFIRSQRERQDDVVSFSATHRVSISRLTIVIRHS